MAVAEIQAAHKLKFRVILEKMIMRLLMVVIVRQCHSCLSW